MKFVFALLLAALCLNDASAVERKIGAFNIQVFGPTKAGKPDVMDELVRILKRYDLVLIQEIRNSDGTAIVSLLDLLNSDPTVNGAYKMEIGPRVGRTSSKEQYCYFYRQDKFEVIDSYTYDDDRKDVFEREPFQTLFRDLDSGKQFVLSGLHAKPDDAPSEIDYLTTVYDDIKSKYSESVLFLGDLNADCSYVTSSEWQDISLRQDSRFTWYVGDTEDTTVKSTDCAYDRFVAAGEINSFITDYNIYNFHEEHNLDAEFAEDVSDHYPIEITLNY